MVTTRPVQFTCKAVARRRHLQRHRSDSEASARGPADWLGPTHTALCPAPESKVTKSVPLYTMYSISVSLYTVYAICTILISVTDNIYSVPYIYHVNITHWYNIHCTVVPHIYHVNMSHWYIFSQSQIYLVRISHWLYIKCTPRNINYTLNPYHNHLIS